MKVRVYLTIVVRIVILFSLAIAFTFFPEMLRGFFGDVLHECKVHGCPPERCWNGNDFDGMYEWGSRHYWYFWMMTLLFILSLIDLILGIAKSIASNYDTKL